ncbi:MAG: hypothetical protein CL938_16275 [Deltaproteobacteria bacterium]|nr:hypothetical protein [Deltaproteobacteria bacterium]
MQRTVFRLVLLAVSLIAAPLAAEETPPQAPPDTEISGIPEHTQGAEGLPKLLSDVPVTSHRVVLITDDALNPDVVTLDEGQLVAWISYSGAESIVVFPGEVARDMRCHSLVNFSFAGDELRSEPISAGEFASFCELRPGRYRYRVVRPIRIKPDDAVRELKGEIRVGDPDA